MEVRQERTARQAFDRPGGQEEKSYVEKPEK